MQNWECAPDANPSFGATNREVRIFHFQLTLQLLRSGFQSGFGKARPHALGSQGLVGGDHGGGRAAEHGHPVG